MLAELMLPDQTHVRSQDWTIFFLHKDTGTDEEYDAQVTGRKKKRREGERGSGEDGHVYDEVTESDDEDTEDEEGGDGPPLMYVLNLVNTKQDTSAKRYDYQIVLMHHFR